MTNIGNMRRNLDIETKKEILNRNILFQKNYIELSNKIIDLGREVGIDLQENINIFTKINKASLIIIKNVREPVGNVGVTSKLIDDYNAELANILTSYICNQFIGKFNYLNIDYEKRKSYFTYGLPMLLGFKSRNVGYRYEVGLACYNFVYGLLIYIKQESDRPSEGSESINVFTKPMFNILETEININ